MAEEIAGWKIWYGDGSSFSSLDGTWESAPQQDVQIVVIYYTKTYPIYYPDTKEWKTENYCLQLSGQDYYWKTNEGVFGAGSAELVPENLPAGATKLGKWLSDEAWLSIYNSVSNIRKFP